MRRRRYNYRAERDAHDQIKARYQRPYRYLTTYQDAMAVVADATRMTETDRKLLDNPVPTGQDLEHALLLVSEARENVARSLDTDELTLIEASLSVGKSWQWIGERLGYEPASAERSAKARRQALRKKFPSRGELEYTVAPS